MQGYPLHLRSWVASDRVSKPVSLRVVVLPCLHSWVHLGVAEWGHQCLCSPPCARQGLARGASARQGHLDQRACGPTCVRAQSS